MRMINLNAQPLKSGYINLEPLIQQMVLGIEAHAHHYVSSDLTFSFFFKFLLLFNYSCMPFLPSWDLTLSLSHSFISQF